MRKTAFHKAFRYFVINFPFKQKHYFIQTEAPFYLI